MFRRKAFVSVLIAAVSTGAGASTFEKSPNFPDQSNLWNALGGPSGAYVFADSFTITGGDNIVTELGSWMTMESGGLPGSKVSYQIWGDNAGPNAADVLTSTAKFQTAIGGDPPTLYQEPTLSSLTLAYNTTYWFVAKVDYADQLLADGSHNGYGAYGFAKHVQNSQQDDNGTFWFTDNPDGATFSNYGESWTPEIAFQVQLTSAPEPAPIVLLGLGALVVFRRRRDSGTPPPALS